jgi:flagellar biosynthesis/type III secretory pathway protein FliH
MRRLTPDRLETLDRPKQIGEARPIPSNGPSSAEAADALRVQHQQAFDAARERGLAEGAKDAERDIAQQVEKIERRLTAVHDAAIAKLEGEQLRLRQFIASLSGALQAHSIETETLAVEVAYAAMVRVLGEKSADRSLLPELCRNIVREYGHPPATLRVSDVDFSLFETSEFDIPVEADRRLLPGQCVIDTARGQFESGLDVRLEALTQALLSAVAEHRGLA